MKRKLKLKSFVLPSVITTIMVITLVVTLTVPKKDNLNQPTGFNYVSNIILGNEIAVMNEKVKIINPYLDSAVTIGKNYYDYKETAENQEKSIVYYDGTYMQNSGISYKHTENFENKCYNIISNPCDNKVIIENKSGSSINVKIFNVNGSLLNEKDITESDSVNLNDSKGIYIIQITESDSKLKHSEKIVKF